LALEFREPMREGGVVAEFKTHGNCSRAEVEEKDYLAR
jgi:hypothetical protein